MQASVEAIFNVRFERISNRFGSMCVQVYLCGRNGRVGFEMVY